MRLQDFAYDLPQELIAQHPLDSRDGSRLMVLDRKQQQIEHAFFHELPRYLRPPDVLVVNNTRVIPARLFAQKLSGGWVEVFLLESLGHSCDGRQTWKCLLKSRRKMRPGTALCFSPHLSGRVLAAEEEGFWLVELACQGSFEMAMQALGRTPLPPYIRRDRQAADNDGGDRVRYQTVYASVDGAVAAPTAGLHFSTDLLDRLRASGISLAFLTLHVGYGTFQPIRATRIEQHRMHQESFQMSEESAAAINHARSSGGRVIAVGTTTTRTLETMSSPARVVRHGQGTTDLFIYPGYTFRAIDALITNFHLPMSSLLLLVAAFAGTDLTLRAYREAVQARYRFFSYGDAMLIV